MKCPFCNEELKETSFNIDGNIRFSHPYIGALKGGKDRCVLDGETLNYHAWQELIHMHRMLNFTVYELKEIDKLLLSNKFDVRELPLLNIAQTKISMLLNYINTEQITVLDKKDN